MADRIDIQLNDDNSFRLINGDFVALTSDTQHIKDILEAAPGHYKEFPTLGANVPAQLNGIVDQKFRRKLKLQLESDGYDINDIELFINE